MLKKIIASSLVAATLILSGCGDSDSAGEDRLAAQHAIDSGDAAKAISLLEPTPISDLNSTQKIAFLASISDTDKMTLASAYMKKADVSIMDIVSKLDTQEGETSSFASIAENIIGEGNTTAKVNAIDTAIAYYEAMGDSSTAAGAPAFKAASANDVKKTIEGAKLYLGMAYFSKVTMLLSYFGDVTALESGSASKYKDNYKATQKALECIHDGGDANCIDNDVIDAGDIAFEIRDPQTGEYGDVLLSAYLVRLKGKYYQRMASTSGLDDNGGGKLLIADYKSIDDTGFGTTDIVMLQLPFEGDYTFESQLLNALNGAYDLILETAPEDVKEDMIEKFAEIDNNPKNSDISMDEIRAYMAKD